MMVVAMMDVRGHPVKKIREKIGTGNKFLSQRRKSIFSMRSIQLLHVRLHRRTQS